MRKCKMTIGRKKHPNYSGEYKEGIIYGRKTNFCVTFKFSPLQYVKVKTHNLNYEGRIIRCMIEDGSQPIYDIDLWINGEPLRREFYEDELESI